MDKHPFHAVPGDLGDPYCILIPLPNITDKLHLGHALNNTLQDILTRYHRARGRNALWMPGTDHAGIATQTVVEKRVLAEEGKRRTDFEREEFVNKILSWKDEFQSTILSQLREMGCSCDWDRTRFTLDDVCAAAVREAFFRLFQEGLIYRGKRLVNWDPATQTALADDEVEMHEVEGHFWYLQYPLIGDPVVIDGTAYDHVTVATTRPETMLGDTAVAMNPRDPRAKHFAGRMIRLPIVNREIPIIEDDYVVLAVEHGGDPDDAKAQFATGFLKVTPAHDPNDWEIGLRHELPIINVLAPDGCVSDQYGWEDVGGGEFTLGLDRYEAREAVVEWFRENSLLEEVKPYVHSVGHSYRSHVAIEPYLSDQWYVAVTRQIPSLDDAGTLPGTKLPVNSLAGFALRAMSKEQVVGDELKQWGGNDSGTGVSPVKSESQQDGGTGVSPVKRVVTRQLHRRARSLPHWEAGGQTYFVTFRCANGQLSQDERRLVLSSCLHWHQKRAIIHLVTVMHDHVHILMTPMQQENDTKHWYPLPDLIHSIKSYSAHEINQARGSSGSVWQDEYYDRIMRDEAEFEEKWQYMWMNPVKAGLIKQAADYEFTVNPQTRDSADECEDVSGPSAHWDGRDARATDHEEGWHGRLTFYPERYARTFQSWHENIRDWCISRQLWWGHRIPVWVFDDERKTPDKSALDSLRGQYPDDLHVITIERAASDDRTGGAKHGTTICACPRRDIPELVEALKELGFAQDPDVLDTWFSSALWPMSTMGWPNPEAFLTEIPEGWDVLNTWNPTSVLCTAREIITLWVSRMVMFNLYFLGRLPYDDVFIHAMIQDGDGRKMSKSLGNGVDPRDIIKTKGSDAMRFTLAQMTTQTQDVRMPVEYDEAIGANSSPKFEIGRRLSNKLWNATRFALMTLGSVDGHGKPDGEPTRLVDRWILARLARTVRDIETAVSEYQFNAYAQGLYDLFWRDFCDWYLEAVKATIATDPTQQSVLRAVLGSIHRMAQPIMPFITETLHEPIESLAVQPIACVQLPPSDMAATARWPQLAGLDQAVTDQNEDVATFERAQALVTAIREIRASHQVPDKRRIALHVGDEPTTALIESADGVVESLAGLSEWSALDGSADRGSDWVTFTVAGVEHALSGLAGEESSLDAGAEAERVGRRRDELEKQIRVLEGRLGNKGYVDKAPPHLVEETRKQLADAKGELDRLAAV
ncbi:MAG: class I tRNA ligase family protein [Planctomycetes bacterium]|nr:class I tRNA ligase family protein [Planctomycetota bacterium]